jgi:HEAT repeat protein
MIEIAGQRRISGASKALLKDMSDGDAAVRTAATKSYGELAGEAEVPVLIDMLIKATDGGEIGTYERVLGSICSIAKDKGGCAKKLIQALPRAGATTKPSLLKVLSVTGGADALKAVRAAVDDSDKAVHTAAIRMLSEWKDQEAAPVLLYMAKNLGNETDKLLSMRGCMSLAMRSDVAEDERIKICKQAAGLIQRDDERKMMLGALGSIKSPASLELVMPYLDNEKVRSDAIHAVIKIVEPRKRAKDIPAKVARAALEKVVAVGGSSENVNKAKELLKTLGGKK